MWIISEWLFILGWAPLKDRRRDIRLAMLFKIVKCNMPVQAGDILLPADPRTRHDLMIIVSSSNIFRHILLSINIRFLSEQYLSELSS